MLTGDKSETAINIGYSSCLINLTTTKFQLIEGSSQEEIRIKLEEFKEIAYSKDKLNNNNFALIINNEEIVKIMLCDDLRSLFYEVCIRCSTVICSRTTPKQKAQMITMIKLKQPNMTCLAIGDGANDVCMITTADIGIGILGKEGKQAARASDYSISQFSFLKHLLFVHGREAYRKNSFIVCYNFYKNTLFVIPQLWYELDINLIIIGMECFLTLVDRLYMILGFINFIILFSQALQSSGTASSIKNTPTLPF